MFCKRRLENIVKLLCGIGEGIKSNSRFLFLINKQLENQERLLKLILRKEITSMSQIEDLKANVADLVTNVAKEKDVVTSAVAAIKGLTDQQAVLNQQLLDAIAAAENVDPAVKAAADAIAVQNQLIIDQTTALAAAIPAGTPAAVPIE